MALIAMIDSTFATPVNFRPIELGYDVVLHSATKYLNGHSDQVAGAICGSKDRIADIMHRLNHLGATLDPHACFLLNRGIATLSLRVERQNENAQALAEFLEARDEVSVVHYPGLESHPHHARARELFAGCGGMLSVELEGGAAAAAAFCNRVVIPTNGPSLGGVETLVTRPATTSHVGMTPEDRAAQGITDGLIRVSVGIEDIRDLTADFAQALEATS